ncbi:hypothetical protein Tco_1076806 [Tanacetum coccineum]
MMVQAQEEMGEGSAMPTDPHHTHHQHINPKRNKDQEGQRERTLSTTTYLTASSFEAEQDRGNIIKTPSQ